jgi:hypothetical protein
VDRLIRRVMIPVELLVCWVTSLICSLYLDVWPKWREEHFISISTGVLAEDLQRFGR